MTAPAILHEHVTNPRAKIASDSLWRVQEQTAAYLEAMGPEATARQLEARSAELAKLRLTGGQNGST